MIVTDDPGRLLWALAALAGFLLVCLVCLWPRRKASGTARYLVLYASQTGQAEEIARRSCARLLSGGRDAMALLLRDVTVAMLDAARTILVVAATTGDGDAPDEGRAFERSLLRTPVNLAGRSMAVLALGDRRYERFCAFGQRLYGWLAAGGAAALSDCIEVDDLDPVALAQWDVLLQRLGAADLAEPSEFTPWRLAARECLNPQGQFPLYRLRLTPEGDMPDWQAGDLAQIVTPDGHHRDYSLASLPREGHVELYVRVVEGGSGSTLLTRSLSVSDTVPLRIRTHRNFHAPQGEGPVLMVAAGSGLAGLRAHILSAGRPGWLVYGERHPQYDEALCREAQAWPLARLDLAFSQPDSGCGAYVQDVLASHAPAVRDHLGQNGAILVCGGLAMGQAVDRVLRDVLGESWLDQAANEGRYRRDLY